MDINTYVSEETKKLAEENVVLTKHFSEVRDRVINILNNEKNMDPQDFYLELEIEFKIFSEYTQLLSDSYLKQSQFYHLLRTIDSKEK